MKQNSIKELAIYVPWLYQCLRSQTSAGVPQKVIEIYNTDGQFGAGLTRPSCPACVQEMVNTLFWAFGRDTGLYRGDQGAKDFFADSPTVMKRINEGIELQSAMHTSAVLDAAGLKLSTEPLVSTEPTKKPKRSYNKRGQI